MVLLLLACSCSGGPTEEAKGDLAERCGIERPNVPVQALPLPYNAASGEGVDGFVLGEGTKGIVFSNQTDTDLCDWLPFAAKTAGGGRRSLIYDYSYRPDAAKEVEAAAAELGRLGVGELVLVGASKGAVGSLAAAPSIRDPELVGVASLSAVGNFEGLDSVEAAEEVRAPLLVLAARGDATTDAGEVAPKLAKASPSKDKRVVVFSGSDHGIDLLEGVHGAEAESLLKGFVDRDLSRDRGRG
jgi:dienelactone hydrolase